jgi:hypothetical protein
MLLKKRTYLGLKQHPEVSFEPVDGGDEASSNDGDNGDSSDKGDNVEHR